MALEQLRVRSWGIDVAVGDWVRNSSAGGQHPVLLVLLLRDQRLRGTTKGQFVASRPGLDEGKQQIGARHQPSQSRTGLSETIVADSDKTPRQRHRTAAGYQ